MPHSKKLFRFSLKKTNPVLLNFLQSHFQAEPVSTLFQAEPISGLETTKLCLPFYQGDIALRCRVRRSPFCQALFILIGVRTVIGLISF